MSSIAFLRVAYAVAWITYLGYLVRILLRMKKVEDETEEHGAGQVRYGRKNRSRSAGKMGPGAVLATTRLAEELLCIRARPWSCRTQHHKSGL